LIDPPTVQQPSEYSSVDTSDLDHGSGYDYEIDEDDYSAPEVKNSTATYQSTPAVVETRIIQKKEPFSGDALKENWSQFLEFLIKDRPNLGSFLSFASIGSVSNDSIELKFSSAYRFQYLEVTKKNNKHEITKLLEEFAGKLIELNIIIDANATGKEVENYIKQIGDIPVTINDQIEKEPIIQTILEVFDGEILN